ncbi:MAG: DUF58 domain-containing protein [Microthrixaceae bacterium]
MVLRFRLIQMLAVAALLGIAGMLFGLTEASALAIGLLGLILASTFRSLLLKPDLEVERVVTPSRCNVGDGCTVELVVKNNSLRPSPAVVFVDTIDGQKTASIQVGPLRPAETASCSFSLATDRRGLLKLGPMQGATIDPFGLTTRRMNNHTADMMVAVRPKIWALTDAGLSSRSGSDQFRSTGVDHRTGDDEFSSLNEYTPGDDVRHIHWPSTARMRRPIVRRNEPMAERHSTIVIDARPYPSDAMAFERALSVVASLIHVSREERTRVLVVSDGEGDIALRDLASDITLGNSDRAEHLLDQLCVLDQGQGQGQGHPDAIIGGGSPTAFGVSAQLGGNQLGVNQSGGRLVVVTPRATSDVAKQGDHLRREMERFGDVLLISTSSAPPAPTAPAAPSSASPASTTPSSTTPIPPPTRLSWPAHFEVMFWDGTKSLTSTWYEYMSSGALVGRTRSGGL